MGATFFLASCWPSFGPSHPAVRRAFASLIAVNFETGISPASRTPLRIFTIGGSSECRERQSPDNVQRAHHMFPTAVILKNQKQGCGDEKKASCSGLLSSVTLSKAART